MYICIYIITHIHIYVYTCIIYMGSLLGSYHNPTESHRLSERTNT